MPRAKRRYADAALDPASVGEAGDAPGPSILLSIGSLALPASGVDDPIVPSGDEPARWNYPSHTLTLPVVGLTVSPL